jgi:hypothetical protein
VAGEQSLRVAQRDERIVVIVVPRVPEADGQGDDRGDDQD